MNLGKLLVAGKSIINGGEEISYCANRRVYLPKFGPAQNPFKTPPGDGTRQAGSGNHCRANPKSRYAACGKNPEIAGPGAEIRRRDNLGEQIESDFDMARPGAGGAKTPSGAVRAFAGQRESRA